MACKRFATPIAQWRKYVVDGLSYGNAEDEKVESVPEDEKLPLLQSRCCISNFVKKIKNWKMDDREWALLRKTPFGGLIEVILELDMNMEIVDALLGFWDEEHCGFLIGGVIIPFTADDIALITGLPNRGQKVEKRRLGFKCDAEFNRIYLTVTNIQRRLDYILTCYRNDPNPETGKRFVQRMLLYLWGSVLFPCTCRCVPSYMCYYVMNLDAIGSYNWAEALHSFLVKEINAKSKVVKERNEGKKVVVGHTHGLFFTINVWFFEHVDFGEDSRPSNPDVRPRMLKWSKGCKFWPREPFLQRFREIVEDKVSYRLLPKNDELELVSLHSVKHMPSQIGGSDNVVRGDPYLIGNSKVVGSGIRSGYEGTEQRGREADGEKKETKTEKEDSSDIKWLKEVVLKQNELISVLVRKVVRLETLASSKGWEIEVMNGEVDEQVGCEHTGTLRRSCFEGEKDHSVEVIGHSKPSGIASDEKRGCQQRGKRKILKSTIAKDHLMLKRRRGVPKKIASISGMEEQSSARFERKDSDMLVNLDDYASPTKMKNDAKVAPLNYVGRELLTENVRKYLDAFCIKPIQRDATVFFNWNISIRRHSMVEYLQGGYTSEEIIDAYARILFERVKMSGDKFANFLYVPPMFLGLYRNKLGSYKTFLKAFDKSSLEKVKLLFLPCHISTANHWLLLVCDMKMRKWTGYDSQYDPRHREAAKEKIMLLTEYLYQDHGLDNRPWILEYSRIYPQQEAGTLDCGVFVMKFIECIIRVRRTINFKSTDMQLFRPQIAYKILKHG